MQTYWNFLGLRCCPENYFNEDKNIISFLDFAKNKLDIKEYEDWYNLTKDDLCKLGGSAICIKSSLASILNIYTKDKFIYYDWIFKCVPMRFWENKENQKQYMNWLFKKLEYKSIEDWYKLTEDLLRSNYGRGLLNVYNDITYNVISNIFVTYEWLPWKFEKTYRGFWKDLNNQRKYMDWLFKELKYETLEDFYKITFEDIVNNYGNNFRKSYRNIHDIFNTLYPEHTWLEWKFKFTSNSFWKDIKNQRKYTEWLFNELKYESMEDWYKTTNMIVSKNYGCGLISSYYNLSIQNMLKSIYPEYKWIPWKFISSPNNFWDKIENQRNYIKWLFKELKYEKIEDWYKITQKDFNNNCGGGLVMSLLNKKSNYKKLIMSCYPEFEWKEENFKCLKGEGICYQLLNENYNLIWGYRVNWCKNEDKKKYLPFDFCIEEYKIIIEVDGEQHFIQVSNWDSPEETRKRDKYKMEKALENGYSVIRILQEDIYYDKNGWKDKLLSSIKIYEEPQIIYLSDIYKNYYNIFTS
jgi:very-short-patch-repair endonuclease